MKANNHWLTYMQYGFIAAIAYITCALAFILHAQFKYAWWLNLGNIFFMAVLFVYGWIQRKAQPSATAKIVAGMFVTLSGIAFSCILIILVYCVHLSPVKNVPATIINGKPASSYWMLFINAIIVNCCCGAFITLMMAYAVQQKNIETPS